MTTPGDPPPTPPDRAPARPVWLFWLIPMAVLVGVVWFILRGDRSDETATPGGTEIASPQAER